MKNPRLGAVQAIAAVDSGKKAQEALAALSLPDKDRQLCSDLVYGTLRNREAVRGLLGKVLPKPENLPAEMLIALETAVYALQHQQKIPDYAILNETVQLIKKRFGKALAGVANAALRAAIKLDKDNSELFGTGINGAALAASLPLPILDLWQSAYGNENANLLMKRSANRPFSGLRVNMRNKQGANLYRELQNFPGVEIISQNGLAFAPGTMPAKVQGQSLQDWQKKGVLSLQAAGSMLVMDKLGQPQHPVWDACAGAGGKTCSLMETGTEVRLATDTSLKRLATLKQQCDRLGLPQPAVSLADAIQPPLKDWCGDILADVPCSGLGVLARRPDLKSRFSLEKTAALIQLQANILKSLTALLQPGRALYYITCTLNPEENEGQIKRILSESRALTLAQMWQTPHEHPWLEGMFGAKLVKTG